MLVKTYRRLRNRLEQLREAYARRDVSAPHYYSELMGLRILIQLIVMPHFLLLGPFRTFTTFARKDEQGSWIDSYNDFIVSNRISITGILTLALIALVAIIVFIYLPIVYI
ncbi:MAG: hypothetical protein V1895_01630 [Parcubacteria group bacterium]